MINIVVTNPTVRALLRRLRVLVVLRRISGMRSGLYEDKFANALLSEVRSGDVVWDVGANVGYYSCKLAQRAGLNGKVFAFEPVTFNYQRLESLVAASGLNTIQTMKLALGSRAERIAIQVSLEGDGMNNSLAKTGGDGTLETISVDSGDQVISGGVLAPDVIKIDVEAYEEEVVFGLRHLWQSKSCRAVFVEIHFDQLEKRGLLRAPKRIEAYFKDVGYKITWIDASHFQAKI